MPQSYIAMITILSEAPGGQPPGGGGSPPGIWGPTDPRPTPPIANVPGGGGGAPGEGPPGIWGGGNQPFPTPPIVIPPQNPGEPPLVIWGGGNVPMPTPPIELPGGETPPPGGDRVQLIEWKTAWTEETGWVVVGVPSGDLPHPTPSGAATGRKK